MEHRERVRCEFYEAIDYPDQTLATMYRDQQWKLVNYHYKGICELYNLESSSRSVGVPGFINRSKLARQKMGLDTKKF